MDRRMRRVFETLDDLVGALLEVLKWNCTF